MVRIGAVLGQATRQWWYEWAHILFMSMAWLVCQVAIVTGPPATAVFYALLAKSAQREWWAPKDAWQMAKAMAWPSWKWAILNLIVVGVTLSNLLAYWDIPGGLWTALRVLWLTALTIWVAMNLLYWPFWLVQSDRSLRNTYANCGRFLLVNPITAVVITAVSLLTLFISFLTILPFIVGSVAWIMFLGITAVNQTLAHQNP
jgi:hypothetical protein